MSFVKRHLVTLVGKIFRNERRLLTAGFPVVLGQGLREPRIQPRMVFYWHPPISSAAAEEMEGKTPMKGRIRGWLDRVVARKVG